MVTISDVSDRLSQLGYETTDEDTEQLTFELDKMIKYSLNYCNITELPEIVYPRLIDRVCSEFLFYKKNSGLLENFDYETTIKSLKEGDTQITYAVGSEGDSPESRFESMVNQLQRGYDKWLTKFRCIKW